MKKPLSHTKVTVKLRKSQYKEEWYLIVEAYPVVSAGNKVERIVESVNRSITTPIWDKSSTTRSSGYKPKRDINGIIMCRSTLDQDTTTNLSILIKKVRLLHKMSVRNRTSLSISRRLPIRAILMPQNPSSSTGNELAYCLDSSRKENQCPSVPSM